MFKTLESGEQEVVVQQVLPAPTNGIFYPMFGQLPPTPFPPNPDLELPVYFWGEGIFLYDDEYLDLGGLRAAGIPLFDTGNNISKSSGNESFMMLLDGPPMPGEGSGGGESVTNTFPPAFTYTNGELYLDIHSWDSNWMTFEDPQHD